MSISYLATWPDGREEDIFLGTSRSLAEGWKPIAERAGLTLIPHFAGYLCVRPELLDQLLAELAVFRSAVAEAWPDSVQMLERVDQLAAALERLRHSEGWEADIG